MADKKVTAKIKNLNAITVVIQVPMPLTWRIRIGLTLMRIGAIIATLSYREESGGKLD